MAVHPYSCGRIIGAAARGTDKKHWHIKAQGHIRHVAFVGPVVMDELEDEAVALVLKAGIFLPASAKEFLQKMAIELKWEKLQGVLNG